MNKTDFIALHTKILRKFKKELVGEVWNPHIVALCEKWITIEYSCRGS